MPTESQWDYACRAGRTTKYSFGDDVSQLDNYSWFRSNSAAADELFSVHRVGLKKPNAWGLRDMQGNVWEMCSDWYADDPIGGRNPIGPLTGSVRVSRGGCYFNPGDECRPASRIQFNPKLRHGGLGFRVAAIPASD